MHNSALVVHSDSSLRREARAALESDGYGVREDSELRFAEFPAVDVLLVAWSALSPLKESLRWLRSHDRAREARVIILAERAQMGAAIGALECGADDCIAAPFSGAELVVRVRASLRRSPAQLVEDALQAGPIVLDRAAHEVAVNGNRVELAPTEFRLMSFFMEHQGRVFSRDELLSRAWSSHVKAGQRTVDVHVRRLRQLLEPFGCETMIETVRGFGYRFRVPERQV